MCVCNITCYIASRDTIQVKATDLDSGALGHVVYSMSKMSRNKHAHQFTVDETTGDIYLARPLDYETTNVHHLDIVARDSVSVTL